jgi:hypothetical protein
LSPSNLELPCLTFQFCQSSLPPTAKCFRRPIFWPDTHPRKHLQIQQLERRPAIHSPHTGITFDPCMHDYRTDCPMYFLSSVKIPCREYSPVFVKWKRHHIKREVYWDSFGAPFI